MNPLLEISRPQCGDSRASGNARRAGDECRQLCIGTADLTELHPGQMLNDPENLWRIWF